MKKRILAMVFAAVMACGIAGCGNDKTELEKDYPVIEEMLTELQSYEAELNAEAAAEAGMFTIEKGAVAGGQEKWDAFMAEEADSVILCQFTVNGGAVLDYVYRLEDGTYLVVSDLTRDGYEYEEKQDYKAQWFSEVKVFENFIAKEGAAPHTICVMTNDANLNADTFLKYWIEMSYEENGAFLLFVV